MRTVDIQSWRGLNVVDRDGDKVGTLEDIYVDRESGQPEWAAVSTGLFGRKVCFVPIEGATPGDGEIRVPYEKQAIKDAPHFDADGRLSDGEERALYEHYGGGYQTFTGPEDDEDRLRAQQQRGDRFDRDETTSPRGTVGRDTSGPTTDDAMTRSEEELKVGTASREVGRARLRKYVVTENVTKTVPVQREEVRIEREPITDANVDDAMSGPDISEEEHEVTLHAEEPVVEKRTVPKERVRLDKDTVTEQEPVSETERKERVEAEGDVPERKRP